MSCHTFPKRIYIQPARCPPQGTPSCCLHGRRAWLVFVMSVVWVSPLLTVALPCEHRGGGGFPGMQPVQCLCPGCSWSVGRGESTNSCRETAASSVVNAVRAGWCFEDYLFILQEDVLFGGFLGWPLRAAHFPTVPLALCHSHGCCERWKGDQLLVLSSHSRAQAPRQGDETFSLQKWRTVGMWIWDVECDMCAICSIQVVVVQGDGHHSFHNCCRSLWVKQNKRLPSMPDRLGGPESWQVRVAEALFF